MCHNAAEVFLEIAITAIRAVCLLLDAGGAHLALLASAD